ncbi:MAG: hypothetical protein ACE5JU_10600 [Candidatus Binatia bacterium]
MIRLSIVLGVLGLFATGGAVSYLSRRLSCGRPQHYWLLGLAALFPAWLVAFLALIPSPSEQGSRASLPPSVIFSSGAGLLGVIFTESVVRKLDKAGYSSPTGYWLLGLLALVPAWLMALWILL